MKIKTIIASMLTLALLAGCSNSDDPANGPDPQPGEKGFAYVSLTLRTPFGPAARASSEQSATVAENTIKTLNAIVFDAQDRVSVYQGEDAVITLTGFDNTGASAVQNPGAFKVSTAAKKILLIANPGTALETKLNSVAAGTHFDVINAAIASVTVAEIKDATKGYTMINSDGLVDIANIYIVGTESGQYTEAEAKTLAETAANRTKVNIERLTAKITFKVGTVTTPTGAAFTFNGWTPDVTNTTLYPYAQKIDLASSTPGGSYANNFYTIDPNYTGYTGLQYGTVTGASFLAANADVNLIENTAAAGEQKFQNLTRIVMKGTYYPVSTWNGDWFSFSGVNYETLADLQTAYADVAKINLREACDKFYTKVKAAVPAITAANFAALTQSDLDLVTNGGDVVKEDKCIKWYQDGVNYFFYTIVHDNTLTGSSVLGKYGVVRNNWYSLTLTSIKGAGTPWYPSVDPANPDPEGPQPPDPVDETQGYMGVEVTVRPWIFWENNIEM